MANTHDLSLQKAGIECRFTFVQHAFTPVKRDNGSMQYQLSILIPKTVDISALKDLALQACKEEWADKAEQWLRDGLIKSPFLDGDGPQGVNKKTGERHEGYAGHIFIRCTSGADYPPKMLVSKNGAVVPATKGDIKSGDYGYPVVNAYTWENDKNGKGVSFGVSMAMKSRDGESLGGGGPGNPDDYFTPIADEGSAPAETKSGDGAAGLFGFG